MAISLTTDWAKIRYMTLLIFATSALLECTVATGLATSGKQKRQLFREHLLPQAGGRVPDSAFIPERISLNKLNQRGLYIPDGLYVQEAYNPHQHQHQHHKVQTLQITLPPGMRGVAASGETLNPARDTSYIIRNPAQAVILPRLYPYYLLPRIPYSSLMLIYKYKHKRQQTYDQIFPLVEDFPTQILVEMAPYLKKLHEYSLDD